MALDAAVWKQKRQDPRSTWKARSRLRGLERAKGIIPQEDYDVTQNDLVELVSTNAASSFLRDILVCNPSNPRSANEVGTEIAMISMIYTAIRGESFMIITRVRK